MGETDKYKYFKFTISVHRKNEKKSIMTSHRLGANKLGPYLDYIKNSYTFLRKTQITQ